MISHPDIQKIAALSFADHCLTKSPARSWRMGRPDRGAYAFRVTWATGVLTVSGDIGEAVYQAWPSFGTLWGAVEFVSRADFDYLCEKGSTKKEFDRDGTVEHLIQIAYSDLRGGSQPRFFDRLCDEYGGDASKPMDRKEAARAFRDDHDLTAERVYNITGDFEAPSYSYPASARWAFEALKLWAAAMKAREPLWHRSWRWAQREYYGLRRELRARKVFRPDVYVTPSAFNGCKFWVRRTFECDGQERARMAAIVPLRLLGLDLSRVGLWREQGSSWPLSGDRRDADFRPMREARRAAA